MNHTISDFLSLSEGKIARPDWSHLNVDLLESKKLKWSEIYIDDTDHNNSKVTSHTAAEIESLRLSFSTGVNVKMPPPAVRDRGPHVNGKRYELLYGFGRSEALQMLNTDSWWFSVLDGSPDALEDVQASENEELPKTVNKECDMIKFLSDKVVRGLITKDESAVRRKFGKIYPNRDAGVAGRVVQKVIENTGIPQPYELYTSQVKVQQWLDNHSSESYTIGGEFDSSRDMYGVAMKEGYHIMTFYQAAKRFEKDGKKTYVIVHCGVPKKNTSLKAKRNQVVKDFEVLRETYQTVFGFNETEWPIVIMDALPQERGVEDWKTLVSI